MYHAGFKMKNFDEFLKKKVYLFFTCSFHLCSALLFFT